MHNETLLSPTVVDILDRLSTRLDPEEIADLTKHYLLADDSMDYLMDYVVTHDSPPNGG